MADDIEHPRRGYETQDLKAERPERPARRRWLWIALLFVPGLPLLLLVLWTTLTLNVSFSEGERTGYLQKFSRKGWLCKTWEGELAMVTMPGTASEIFRFTVREDAVAARIRDLMRKHEGRIALAYEQHRFIPTHCFGETEYFVTDARPVTR